MSALHDQIGSDTWHALPLDFQSQLLALDDHLEGRFDRAELLARLAAIQSSHDQRVLLEHARG